MKTYYDALNEFFRRNEAEPLASSAQLVYLHLLQLNNSTGRSGQVTVSDRKLMTLTQLSRPTITAAKRTLKNVELIDFDGGKHGQRTGTRYTLCIFLASDLASDLASRENSNIRVREEKESLEGSSFDSSITRARAPVNWNCEIESRLTELWVKNRGAPVSFELLSYFKSLVDKHGLTFVEDVIREAAFGYGGDYNMSGKYLRGCVERKLKGGDADVRVARQPERVCADGHRRRNVVDFATGARAAGKGRFDDDEPDTAWIYEGQNSNGGDG